MSAYNSSSTIGKAIKSVINQTYKNWELIIVDDFSTDNTVEVIKSFNDERIKLIKHSNNLGAGCARSTGISYIVGDYTTFLDSDDYYDSDFLEVLLGAALKHNADIVTSGYRAITGNTSTEYSYPLMVLRGRSKYEVPNRDDKYRNTPVLRFLNTAIVKTALWGKVEYSKRRYIEDTQTLYKLLYYANKRVIIPDVKYNYVQRRNSLTHTADRKKEVIYHCLAMSDIYNFEAGLGSRSNGIIIDIIRQLKSTLSYNDYKKYANQLSELLATIINSIKI